MPESNNHDAVKVLAKTKYNEWDGHLSGMERRAMTAEIILGIVIAIIINLSCFLYCKGYNKKESEGAMQAAVNEQVSQYFALAANEHQAAT